MVSRAHTFCIHVVTTCALSREGRWVKPKLGSLTNNGQSGSSDQRRICRNQTLVDPGVIQGRELDLKLPIVWLFVEYLVTKKTGV